MWRRSTRRQTPHQVLTALTGSPAPKRCPDPVPTSGKRIGRGSGVHPKRCTEAFKGRKPQRVQQPRAKLGKTPSRPNFMGPSSDQHD